MTVKRRLPSRTIFFFLIICTQLIPIQKHTSIHSAGGGPSVPHGFFCGFSVPDGAFLLSPHFDDLGCTESSIIGDTPTKECSVTLLIGRYESPLEDGSLKFSGRFRIDLKALNSHVTDSFWAIIGDFSKLILKPCHQRNMSWQNRQQRT